MKKIKVLLLIFVIVLGSTLVSCKKKKPDPTPDPVEMLPSIVEQFIDKTEGIEEVSLNSKDDLDLCILLYSCIEETLGDVLDDEKVVSAKAKLDSYIKTYNELKLAKYESEKSQALILSFIEVVGNLPSIDLVMLEDLEKILVAESNYNSLSSSDKENTSVIAAKEVLDLVRSSYDAIAGLDEEGYKAHKFVVAVNNLPTINELSIEHISVFELLIADYESFNNENKTSEKVISAKQILDTYSPRILELKVSQKKAEDFIMAVFSLPTGGGLKWQNAEQRNAINSAFTEYESLTEFEKTISGVEDAYKQLNVIKNTFDNLKEPYDISKIKPTNLCFYVPGVQRLKFDAGKDPISVLKNDYGLTDDTIKDNVKIYLDVYIEGGAIAGSPLFSVDITEDQDVTLAEIIEMLKEIRDAGNEAVITQGYTFTIHIESLNEQYASSEYSSFFSAMNISLG